MKVLIVVLAALAVSFAQIPKKCGSPPAWEARVLTAEYNRDRVAVGRFYYDAEGQRTAFSEEEYQDGQVVTVQQEYRFHKEKYELVYDERTKQCYRRPLDEPFRPINISSTARFVDTFVIGTNADERFGVTVNLWEDFSQYGRSMLEFVADDGDGDENCLPIAYTFIGQQTGVVHSSFYNIVLGVNPSHFIPPPECNRI